MFRNPRWSRWLETSFFASSNVNDESSVKTALWVPSWYEMDQSLVLGVERRYWFFIEPPFDLSGWERPIDLVFYNQMGTGDGAEIRFATVTEIWHPELGTLDGIDTDGLDYVFARPGAEPVIVNAEESPGRTEQEDLVIEDWSVLVTLENVSEPLSDVT